MGYLLQRAGGVQRLDSTVMLWLEIQYICNTLIDIFLTAHFLIHEMTSTVIEQIIYLQMTNIRILIFVLHKIASMENMLCLHYPILLHHQRPWYRVLNMYTCTETKCNWRKKSLALHIHGHVSVNLYHLHIINGLLCRL